MANFEYEIIETYGELSENSTGWKKMLTSVSWNHREPKYDIRDWSPDLDKMGKGVTFTKEELKQLKDILNQMDL